MIFFLINRFRRKKLRARESRQTAEDQRSIVGSIGYIAGNMGYMEGNLSSMDYTYGGAATHYPLWKPPSGYFPRGEAPPPYDEAVAISQAEALSAQCAAAAAAAQAAANQRVTMGMNTVELQNADMNRRAQANPQMQQIQHHAQPQTAHHQPTHVVPTTLQTHVLAPPSQQQPNQSHQITQSTTNLINININSGGNITTIATGENHQPPYSLQDENVASAGIMQQQSSALATQQMQMQQQQQQLIASSANGPNGQGTNGRVHIAQSNSICVQTMAPLQQQQQQQQPVQQTQQQATAQNSVQSNQMLASNSNTLSRQPQNLVMSTTNDCGYKNCHLSSNNSTNTLSRRVQRTAEPLQQYVVDVEVNVGSGNSRGYHSLPPCQNSSSGDLEVIASPTQFSNNTSSIANAISTPAIDQVSTNSSNQNIENLNHNSANNAENCTQQLNQSGHNTLPLQHNQSSKSSSSQLGVNIKNSSTSSSSSNSSKRYHRTMPRYYAVADPLSTRETLSATTSTTNALNTASKSSKTETKLTANNIMSSNSNNSSANSSLSSSKKPTCQCPVQHVPMSYMGSTQLTNAQNVSNNAFFTVLSNKLSSSANNSPSNSSQQQQQQQQQQHSQRLQTNSNTNSLNYQPRPKSSQSLAAHTTRDGSENISVSTNNTMKRSLNSHCNYEPKISTISTGELQNASAAAANNQAQHHQQQLHQQQQQQQQQHHHHSHSHSHHHGHHSTLLPPPQHHDDSSPIVLGRVTKRSSSSSSGDRLRSASSGSTRSSLAESVGITSPAAAAYLNSKVDAYLNFAHGTSHHLKANDLINPALPPKLHKSLTNLKSTTSTITTSATTNHRKSHNNNSNNNDNASQANNNINNSNTTSTNCNNFSSSSLSSSALSSAMNNAAVPASNTTSVQTIYTLSKPHHSSLSPAPNTNTTSTTTNLIGLTSSTNTNSNLLLTRKSEHEHIMKITQQQPPSLTLPLSTTSTISSFTSSTSKINSSTFYPLQNNVTYTLPKNIGGKMSLNSTINSVVSKVPSVISLPSTSASTNENINCNNAGGENHSYHSNFSNQMLNDAATSTSAISKSTTLPKILRTKRDLHNNTTMSIITSTNNASSSSSALNHHNTSANNSNINSFSSTSSSSSTTSTSITTTNTSSNYAVSQCSMPAYPKQYSSMSSANNAATTLSTSSSVQQQQQQQNQTSHSHQPTNINMQTQTITSTLAANYCPEDSHLNIHNPSNTSHSSTTTFNTSSSSSGSSSKQLPVCTTSKNCLNPKEHFLPNDTSLDDDYLSECENCKIAQSSKYYLDAEALASGPQETMTLQRKSMEECKEEPETGYYRISHTLPTNSKKNASYFS
ncbi:uncharacterized protein ACRADG_000078 isoform 2-T4 [Cochliomyia hominivorax]